jgi:hypothetical protein
MLLYLVQHSGPDISNAIRELSKVAYATTEAHWNKLIRAITFTVMKNAKVLKLTEKQINELFYIEGVSEDIFGEDQDTILSFYGYVVYLCDAPVATKSKSGRSVTLSSSEAEYQKY